MYNGSAYVQALYSSLDNCVTWAKIGEQYPDGWTDWVKDLTGDMSNYGWVYIAKSGSSFGVLTPDATPAFGFPSSPIPDSDEQG